MNFRPGGNFAHVFFTQTASGTSAAADSLPTAFAVRNGVLDSAVAPAVAAVTGKTGMYAVTGQVPATYLTGDVVQIVAQATVAGVTLPIIAGEFVVQSILNRFTFVVETSTYQPMEDNGVTPLAGTTPPITLLADGLGNILRR